ncbi:MAG: c-type cytochrome [Deltaproteobacteria bacterium]|nr:c-type cytochrome [Deltaproteobacteria bacterium]
MVFLLQYVGGDYGVAVKDGKVIDELEYRENSEFAALIAEGLASLRGALPPAKVAPLEAAVRRLGELIAARADARQVKEVAESAIPLLVDAFALRSFPRQRPEPATARGLFAESCVPCHGQRGEGDGPRAKELTPPPVPFSDRPRMDATAPYVFYNAITFGVANTSMASFADSLSDQQRWDLAFYLWTLSLPPGESAEPPPVTLSLRDLATRSAEALAPEVVRQAAARGVTVDEAQAALWVARLRASPPILSDAQERLARLRQDLATAVALLDAGDPEAATDRLTSSYLSEFEPLEPEIDRHDPRVRQSVERDLIEFRSALRRNDRAAARTTVSRLERTVERAAALLGGRAAAPPSRTRAVGIAAAIAAAVVAGFVIRRRLERP